MNLKGGSQAPPTVDPMALAQAQTQSNIDTAQYQSQLNNVNTTSPFGTSLFSQDPTTHQWSLNQSLAPQLSSLFGNQVGLAGTLAGLGGTSAGNVANQFGQLPGFGTTPEGITSNVSLANSVSMNPAGFNLPPSITNAGPLQRGLDFSGLTQLPSSASDFGNAIHDAENAAYRSQAQYLDPQFAQRHSDLAQQLADQGIDIGNTAYSRATGDLGRQENLAYQGAQDAATLAGQAEQQRLFGENLQSRQQGVGERAQQGQFANQAQGQQYQQNAADAAYQSAADQQVFNQQMANAQLFNQAALAGGQFGNQAQQQAYGQQQGGFGDLASILGMTSPNANFGWATGIPTYGSQNTTVRPADYVGAQNAANTAGINNFAAGNTLNNQLFNGLGSLGGALGFGNGGLGNFLGLGSLGGLFGGGAGAAGVGAGAGGLGAAGFGLPLLLAA